MTDDGDSTVRAPPHSLEAEQSVLGALLQEPETYSRVCDLLTHLDFFRHEHRVLFAALEDMAVAGIEIDMITVLERLKANGTEKQAGGLSYLHALSQSVPSAANVRQYAEIVLDAATRRQLIATADEIATAAFNPKGRAVADLLDEGKTALGRIADSAQQGRVRRLPVMSLGELEDSATATPWIVKGVLPAKALGMLFGASGTFKSFIALDAALHVAYGLPWMGRRTSQGNVLWVAAEGGSSIGFRARAWRRARNLQRTEDFRGIPASIDLGTEAWRVVDAVQTRTAGFVPSLVVVDTLSQTYTAGADENSATDMSAYLRELGVRFRDLWSCTVLLVHHSGHSAVDRPRGSSAIQANTSFLFGCFRDATQMLATLTCEHQKEGDRFDDATFSLTKIALGTDEDGEQITHLAARHLSTAEAVNEAQAAEMTAGRGGKDHLLMSIAQNGMEVRALRKAFYEDCGLDDPDSQRKAFNRALGKAKNNHQFEVVEGLIVFPRGSR